MADHLSPRERSTVAASPAAGASPLLISALTLTLLLLIARLDLAQALGLSDGEAIYVAYAFHPQPAYLDHPGLIGWIARELGPDLSPVRLHSLTAVLATALPWVGVLAARAGGATGTRAVAAFFPLALLPALSIGGFAFTPDLPFAHCWLATLACASLALRARAGSLTALAACLGAGFFAALTCLSRIVGLAMPVVLMLAWLGPSQRPRLRTLAPWAASATFVIVLAPLISWWIEHGVSLSDGGASTLTALMRSPLHATPFFLLAGGGLLRDLWQRRDASGVERLLHLAAWVPLLPALGLAALTSAGGDWLTPTALALSTYLPRARPLAPWLRGACAATGLSVGALGWCWLRTDLPLWVGDGLGGYDALSDASNDYYSWGPGRELVRQAATASEARLDMPPLVVGAHPALCAQAEVALDGEVAVGCDTLLESDYDRWLHRRHWPEPRAVLFVTDSRFHAEPPATLYGREPGPTRNAEVIRFGRTVRRISVTSFERTDRSAQGRGGSTDKPASTNMSRSSSVSGFGVVSNRSP